MGKLQRRVNQLREGPDALYVLSCWEAGQSLDAQPCAGKHREKAPASEKLLGGLGEDRTPRGHHRGKRSLGYNLDTVLLGRLQGGSWGQREEEPRRAF